MSLKYYNTAIAMQEIPDEISFVINITGCPHHCEGCHSPHLWENGGYPLSWALDEAFRYVGYISCILFMGGDWDMPALQEALNHAKAAFPDVKLGLYTSLELEDVWDLMPNLDYIKTGPYVKQLGGLSDWGTNQRLYKIISTSDEYTFKRIYPHTTI